VPYGDLAALEEAVDPEVAAVILEPMPSVGGIRLAPPEWFRGVAACCRRRGAMLVFDEVQTGFGRTGTLFFGEHVGVTPDLITGAKGVAGGFPAGVVFVREDVAGRVKNGEHGTTFGGGPLAAAAIAATARAIVDEGLAANAARVGDVLARSLAGIPGVASVVGLGLMLGVNLDRPYGPVVAALAKEGILVGGGGGPTQVRLLPPLTLTEEEALRLAPALRNVLARAPSP
jgi:acetylornithine/succinyldiaminopimelate/putrescine aminotransferase